MIPIELKTYQRDQRALLKISNAKRIAAQLRIPLVGDPQFITTNRAFDIIFFLLPITKLLGSIVSTRILAWSFHEVSYVEFFTMVKSGLLGSVDLKAKRETIQNVKSQLSGHSCLITKTRAKVILVESTQGLKLSITSQPCQDGEIHTVSLDPEQWTKLSDLWSGA
jgi:hypothetical protein